MIRLGIAGLGKMGLLHLAIANTHPDITVAAACDASSYVRDVIQEQSGLKCYSSYDELLAREELDAVVIATPSKLHAAMVESALQRNLAVFCEKPFVLDPSDGERLVELCEASQLVGQVGYHFRFVAAFQEAARIAASGELGEIHHVRVEAYGPVVLKPKGSTWRSTRAEGGGALYDYACHAIDLVNFVAGVPAGVEGVVMNSIFSRDVEDEIYCTLRFESGASGQLAVNWSDESHRKMSTRIALWGSRGRLVADRQECQVYARDTGWRIRYTTDLTPEVWFYLRGEEYSAQIDYFAQSIKARRLDGLNNFRSALATDRVVAMIRAPGQGAPRRTPLLTRLLGT